MIEPIWIRSDVVLAIHKRQIAEHGGAEGTNDLGLLDSVLARPKNLLAYSEEQLDLCSLAAAYGYGIARNHAFVDGNKRVAYVTCMAFLKLNGRSLDVPLEEKYSTFLKLASGEITEKELADWLRSHSAKR